MRPIGITTFGASSSSTSPKMIVTLPISSFAAIHLIPFGSHDPARCTFTSLRRLQADVSPFPTYPLSHLTINMYDVLMTPNAASNLSV